MHPAASPAVRTEPVPRAGVFVPQSDPAGHALALRLHASIDAEQLREQLRRWWQPPTCRRRSTPSVMLSVVETCARSRQDRERDALKLLRLEADAHPRGEPHEGLRATLVSLDATEHLLLLVVDPGAASAAGLPALSSALAHHYPACSPA